MKMESTTLISDVRYKVYKVHAMTVSALPSLRGLDIEKLSIEDLRKFCNVIEVSVYSQLCMKG